MCHNEAYSFFIYIRNTFILFRLIDGYVISTHVLCFCISLCCAHTHSHTEYKVLHMHALATLDVNNIHIFHRKSIMNFGNFIVESQCQPDSSATQSPKVIGLIFKFQFQQCCLYTLVSYFYLVVVVAATRNITA